LLREIITFRISHKFQGGYIFYPPLVIVTYNVLALLNTLSLIVMWYFC